MGVGYPFYGELVTEPGLPLGELLDAESVIVGPELLGRLDVNIGDALRIGSALFTINGTVIAEPDRLGASLPSARGSSCRLRDSNGAG